MTSFRARARGALLGLAVGDALGAPVEFSPFGDFEPVTGFRAGGPFDLPAGYWTDDTSMALCLGDSLIASGGYDSYDVMGRYLRWVDEGYRSSKDYCFDIGNQTRNALRTFRENPVVPAGAWRGNAAGNAPVMRYAPVGIAAAAAELSQNATGRLARVSARETHYSQEAEEATVLFSHLMREALTGAIGIPAASALIAGYTGPDHFGLVNYLDAVVDLPDAQVPTTGYIRNTIGVAWWGLLNTSSFQEGALRVVNLGGDADTNGAVYGQLAGALYGVSGIPAAWLDQLYDVNEIAHVADALAGMPTAPILRTRFDEDN